MKRTKAIVGLFLLMILIAGFSTASAQSIDYRLSYNILRPHQDTLLVDFYIQRFTSTQVPLGSSTFFLSFNDGLLDFVGKRASYDGPWDNGYNSSWYSDVRIAQPNPSNPRFSLDIERNPSAGDPGGLPSELCPTRAGRAAFFITDPNNTNWGISWIRALSTLYDWTGNYDFVDNGTAETFDGPPVMCMDFGDAPASYDPSGNESSHAFEGIVWGSRIIHLGDATNNPDDETAPQSGVGANGDDNDGTDDENGVTMPTSMQRGAASTIPVAWQSASGTTIYIKGWFDWDGVGGNAPVEVITRTISTGSGTENISVTPPATGTGPVTCYARFRISQNSSMTFNGTDTEGEVEDYTFVLDDQPAVLDFGDAPSSYGTATASHVIPAPTVLYLGTVSPDAELVPSIPLDGTGDDVTPAIGPDDEEGVLAPVVYPGVAGNWQILFTKPTGTAYLSGWVDWDNDGTFNNTDWSPSTPTGERFVNVTLTTQASPLVVGIPCPASVPAGATRYARFRISSTANMTPIAGYADGEIEDYAVTVTALPSETDFGDAPATYGTSTAMHVNTPSAQVFMNVAPDNEAAPSAPLDGTGDDVTATDDEVVSGIPSTPIVGGTSINASVAFTRPSGRVAYIRGWMDSNFDGDFLDAGEQVIDELVNTSMASPRAYSFATPTVASQTTTYLRIRMSDVAVAGGMQPDFGYDSGEVEDYAIVLDPATCPANPVVPTEACTGVEQTFTANAPAGATVVWHIDGQDLTGDQVTYTFTTPGTELVSLDVTCAGGGTSHYGDYTVLVYMSPDDYGVTTDPTGTISATIGQVINFSATLDPVDATVTVTWHFGDGATATGLTAQHAYSAIGNYNVYLTLGTVHCGSADTPTQVTVQVVEGNQPPLAINDINNTWIDTPVSGNVLTNDSDPDGDPLHVGTYTQPGSGSVTMNTATGAYTYTPPAGWTGTTTFTYTACDDGTPALCDQATVTIEVFDNPPAENDPPVANDDNAETQQDIAITIDVKVNDFDPEGDPITVTAITQPAQGAAVLNPDQTVTYTPPSGFTGEVSFTYTLCDNGTPSLCDQATVTIVVHADEDPNDNNPPYAVDDAAITDQGNPVIVPVLDNDFDPDPNDILDVTVVSDPPHGTAVVNPDNTVTYTPDAGYSGPDHFTYTVCDNGTPQLCDVATVYITVIAPPGQCDADFGWEPSDHPCIRTEITFTATNPNATSYTWTWGDGTMQSSGNPVTHMYEHPGYYAVTLHTVCADGSEGTRSRTIQVFDPPHAGTANPTGTPSSGYSPLDVQFAANPAPGAWITAYDWDFGDGSAHSALQNVLHTYINNTDHTVEYFASLRITNGCGDFDYTNIIRVLVEPSISYDYAGTGTPGAANTRHLYAANTYIGTGVDAESAPDDPAESDGLTFSNMIAGQNGQVIVTVSQPGYVSMWLDFNNSSAYDSGEKLIVDQPTSGSPFTVNLTGVPAGTYNARFRYSVGSASAVNSATGYSDNLAGEVQDLRITVAPPQAEYDYGSDGLPRAGHRYDINAFIGRPTGGPWVDSEPSENDGSENDGIEFAPDGHHVTLYVSQNGVIAGWVDFDGGDGAAVDFTQAYDLIIPAQAITAGFHTFAFNWPAGFVSGTEVWSRFRFSTSTQPGAVQSPTGVNETYGEVQDYVFDLTPVELSSFEAKSRNGLVRLEWRTQSETENMGFHVYRSDAENGDFERINHSLIPGAGTTSSVQYYDYEDAQVAPGKTYFYKLADVDYKGRLTMHGPVSATVASPVDYVLEQNYPNPFNPETRINFRLKEPGFVTMSVYNMKGQEVRSLVAKSMGSGAHTVTWDGKDNSGIVLPTGTYIYKLQVNGFEVARKMEFVK